MITITPRKIIKADVNVPGSKSYSHRICIAAALSDGLCMIKNCLSSEDINYTLSALRCLGVRIEEKPDALWITGRKGLFDCYDKPIDLGNSGTSMRLITGLTAIGKGIYNLTGSDRMQKRPMNDLLDGLRELDIFAVSIGNNGCPPLQVKGGEFAGMDVHLNCSVSSQYLSSLLLVAPITKKGLRIHVTHGPISKPYIDMTLDIMSRFGITVSRDGYLHFYVPGNQTYRSGSYVVEPDCSQAGYFWAAAAITGSEVKVKGVTKDSKQGDVKFLDVLASMGCQVSHASDGISVIGGSLSAVKVDMADMPDLVPTLAVVASFAKGHTVIKNVAHLRAKESDRLSAISTELSKMGISVTVTDKDLIITGGNPHGAVIECYKDHRIAMSFAMAGLVVPGVTITDKKCVEKSFPKFWEVLDAL